MPTWRGLRERIAALIRGRVFEREMEEEFSFHLEKAIERNLAAGMDPEEARREAIHDFGGLERRKDETREVRGFGALIDLRRDVTIALRTFRRNPGFTAVAVFTLAIGIGANTAIFSVVSGVMLQPLPYEEPENLVAIYSRFTPESGYDFPKYPVGSPEYFDYIRKNKTMGRVAAVSTETVTMTAGEGEPEHIKAGTITASLLPTLRVKPFIGRNISEEEDLPGAPWVFLISYDLWQRRFGGDPDVLGMSIDIGLSADVVEGGGSPGQIIGVMPPGFAFPDSDTDLWYSLQLDPARTWRGGHWFSMVGRLAPGITLRESRAEMETLMEAWAVEYPDHHVGHGLYMFPLLDDYVRDIRPALLVLFGAVGFVLLIACLNVASLLMACGEGRRLEIAVRGALGAGRARLLKQLLTESMLLSLAGGAIGILLARTGVRVLLALESVSLPREELITLDSQVLTFSVAAIFLTSLIFGLMPSFQAAGVSIAGTLKDGGRGATTGKRRLRYRKLLVITEIAIAITLVTGAGLMVRSFRNLVGVNPGFETENLLAVRLSLPPSRYTPDQAFFFYKDLTWRMRDGTGSTSRSPPSISRTSISLTGADSSPSIQPS